MKALLIDDHALFRDALGLLIAQRFPTLEVLHAGDLRGGLVQLHQQGDIELVLLDLGLPDSQGLSAIKHIHAQSPSARIVVLSADNRHETVEQAIEQGACGFVPKTAQGDVLAQALALILAGGVYLPPDTRSPADRSGRAGAGEVQMLVLTNRQSDVMRLLIDGQSNKLIARHLGLSDATVKSHLSAIFRELDVSNRTQAVLAAARLGWRFQAG